MIDHLDRQQQHRIMLKQLQHQATNQQASSQPLVSLNEVDTSAQRAANYYHQQQMQSVSLINSSQANSLDTAQPPQQQQQSPPAGNELIGYYFGSISRETSEWILKNHSNHQDGAYLLRSSGPNDDFVLSLMVVRDRPTAVSNANCLQQQLPAPASIVEEVLHYKIVETDDSFVALHGQVGDEKFATIDELIEKAQGVATKPCWPVLRKSLETQILPPTYWGLSIDQVRLAILIKAKQWGFPLFSQIFQPPPPPQQQHYGDHQSAALHMLDSTTSTALSGSSSASNGNPSATTLNNETIRTLVYKSLHEFQPWFHGKIGREEAEQRMESGAQKDGRFLVRERDNFSYAMCISHKRTTKHYRIDVLPTGELAIQDGHKFTSLMALVSHYTIMSDGLWCALTEACPRPIIQRPGGNLNGQPQSTTNILNQQQNTNNHLYCVPPPLMLDYNGPHQRCKRSSSGSTNGAQQAPGSKQQAAGEQQRQSKSIVSSNHSSTPVSQIGRAHV